MHWERKALFWIKQGVGLHKIVEKCSNGNLSRCWITQGNRFFRCWMMDLTGFNAQTSCYHYDWNCAPVIIWISSSSWKTFNLIELMSPSLSKSISKLIATYTSHALFITETQCCMLLPKCRHAFMLYFKIRYISNHFQLSRVKRCTCICMCMSNRN